MKILVSGMGFEPGVCFRHPQNQEQVRIQFFIYLLVRTMTDQDELVQVGFEATMLEESMAQDDSFEGNHSLQPQPEVILGETMTVTMLGHPHHQISLTEDLAIPMGFTPNNSRSASLKPFDMNQMMEMLKQIMEQQSGMRSDMQGKMDKIEGNIQTQMKAGQDELKAELEKVKSEMQNMDRNFTNDIRTVREEMNGLKENVEDVWTTMKMGKEEVTNKNNGG